MSITELRNGYRGWLLVPALGMVASTLWLGLKINSFPARDSVPAISRTAVKFAPENFGTAPSGAKQRWAFPVAQSRGPEWIFDLFTPPEIYFDDASRRFSVTQPKPASAPTVNQVDDFGVMLEKIEREPFRLQLVGFVGAGENAAGLFENIRTTEHFLARSGRRLPEIGLTIQTFKLRRRMPVEANPELSSGAEWIATATISDDLASAEIYLNDHERNLNGPWTALFRSGEAEETSRLHIGESLSTGAFVYTLDRIDAPNGQAVVTRKNRDDGLTQTATLNVIQP